MIARAVNRLKRVVYDQRGLRILLGYGESPVLWTTLVRDRETQRLICERQPSSMDALEISGERWREFGFRSYESVQFPEFDICGDVLPGGFDVIIAEEVFEHLLWPLRAGKNAFTMLNAGGFLLLTTPFMVRIHECPNDCTRWTETGLKYLLAECGFPLDGIVTGSWGNRACARKNSRRWYLYNRYFRSLKNEPDYPVSVWALAEKPQVDVGSV